MCVESDDRNIVVNTDVSDQQIDCRRDGARIEAFLTKDLRGFPEVSWCRQYRHGCHQCLNPRAIPFGHGTQEFKQDWLTKDGIGSKDDRLCLPT